MKCILLAAAHSTVLERAVRDDASGQYSHLVGVPKALLPSKIEGNCILDLWWKAIRAARLDCQDTLLVTNGDKYKHFERWASAHGFPRTNIINDGTTCHGPIGAVADLDLAIRRGQAQEDDILVIAGDMAFQPDSFDLDGVIRFFRKKQSSVICYYSLSESRADANETQRGMLDVDDTHLVTSFVEKPKEATPHKFASVVFYCLKRQDVRLFCDFAAQHASAPMSLGVFIQHLVRQNAVYGMKLPDHFRLIGSTVTLADYQAYLADSMKTGEQVAMPTAAITRTAYARIGLMGNPSDGFFGKTISVSIQNYWAEATISPSDRLILVPHPLNDPASFGSLGDLHGISSQEGYQGGLRLMQATCKRFFEYCSDHGLMLPLRNFTLSYDTNIPRQVGLAGSSAICTAVLQCLLSFFSLEQDAMPPHIQASFVLGVETKELGINAGLQDRVIQAYGGCVAMDFSKHLMERGYGEYTQLGIDSLPRFWLAYIAEPSDSGKIHSTVRQRFDNGDQEVISAMAQFAGFTDEAVTAIKNKDAPALADLMDANFNLRRSVYGDACLGEDNLRMVAIARKHNAAAKFSGSGGAVVGLARPSTDLRSLQSDFEKEKFVFVWLTPNPPLQNLALN
eukprot:m.279516 g.279516  ORF g.279516 m.279516 type:complete len:623 (-) comp15744_c0_seq8:190-2058(-)